MLDLFSTTPNIPKCLVPIQYLSRSIEMLCYVFYDEKLISTKLNKHLGGSALLTAVGFEWLLGAISMVT